MGERERQRRRAVSQVRAATDAARRDLLDSHRRLAAARERQDRKTEAGEQSATGGSASPSRSGPGPDSGEGSASRAGGATDGDGTRATTAPERRAQTEGLRYATVPARPKGSSVRPRERLYGARLARRASERGE